jgi:hypothetical protein
MERGKTEEKKNEKRKESRKKTKQGIMHACLLPEKKERE